MTVTKDRKAVKYVWDYVAGKAVEESEMPEGSDRWQKSEKAKWEQAQEFLRFKTCQKSDN